MKLPWTKPEHREQDYSDAVVAAILARAQGEVIAGATGGLEIAAGLWQRSFSAAEVEPSGVIADLLTPWLGTIGRALVLTGDITFAIDTGDGLALVLASSSTVSGSYNPAEWRYDLSLPGPSSTVTRTYGADRVLHLQYAQSRKSPWLGISPLEASGTTKLLLETIEQKLAQEFGASQGHLMPVPNIQAAQQLQVDIDNLRGETKLVESTNQSWGSGLQGVPTGDHQPRRIGAAVPDSSVMLRRQVEETVLAACGIPQSVLSGGDGTSAREGARLFLYGTIQPVADQIARVVSRHFGQPVRFNFSRLMASDISSRSRAVGSFVQAGMSLEDALKAGMAWVEGDAFYDDDGLYRTDEANVKNESGSNGLDTNQSANYPWTGRGRSLRPTRPRPTRPHWIPLPTCASWSYAAGRTRTPTRSCCRASCAGR